VGDHVLFHGLLLGTIVWLWAIRQAPCGGGTLVPAAYQVCVSATKGLIMNRIVHLALKVEDLEKTTAFYQHVFGFQEVETARTRDHISRHLTDGTLDFTLIKYDEGTQSKESQASGVGPCIHHFAIEVEDLQQAEQQIKSFGCEIISDPGVIPIKFRAPGGTIAELVPVGRYKQPQSQ
jgi:lactoylglutathione lyase